MGVDEKLPAVLKWALDRGEHLESGTSSFIPTKKTDIHRIWGWVGPRTGLDVVKRKVLLCREPNHGRPVRSEVPVLTEVMFI